MDNSERKRLFRDIAKMSEEVATLVVNYYNELIRLGMNDTNALLLTQAYQDNLMGCGCDDLGDIDDMNDLDLSD